MRCLKNPFLSTPLHILSTGYRIRRIPLDTFMVSCGLHDVEEVVYLGYSGGVGETTISQDTLTL